MRLAIAAVLLLSGLQAAADPVQAAGDYRVCTPEASAEGRWVVKDACGTLAIPDFTGVEFQSAEELEAGRILRDAFLREVATYSACVTDFITTSQQPGMPADSTDPDKAACAHSWAEDQATMAVRGFGQACVDYANRSVMDIRVKPYDGPCYPAAEVEADS